MIDKLNIRAPVWNLCRRGARASARSANGDPCSREYKAPPYRRQMARRGGFDHPLLEIDRHALSGTAIDDTGDTP
ncbi:hypothetical protein, partial [Bacillus licheniformis]|uniref:hypothetical protein n=1 Tax=Bacillus licheniformis TaxID=1402 RepID=UPI00203BB832